MNPDFSILDHPDHLRRAVQEHAPWLQAHPFNTEDLLLDWFPVLEKCWVLSDQRQQNLNDLLFDMGYSPKGEGLNPTWHWAAGKQL